MEIGSRIATKTEKLKLSTRDREMGRQKNRDRKTGIGKDTEGNKRKRVSIRNTHTGRYHEGQ